MTAKTKSPQFITNCILAILAIAGLIVVGIGFNQLYYGTKSYSWPLCEGVVRQAEVGVSSGGRGGGSSYYPSIDYEYTVEGHQYSGGKYRYGGINSGREAATKIVAEHPVGSKVKVYYDLSSPERSVLVPGRGWGAYFAIVLGMIFFLVGLICLLPERYCAVDSSDISSEKADQQG